MKNVLFQNENEFMRPHLPRKVEVSRRQTESEKWEREKGGFAIL